MRIAITSRLDEIKAYGEIRFSLDSAWFELLSLISNQITILPITPHITNEQLKSFDLIVFSGGNDVSSVNASKLSRLRDNVEKKIFDCAVLNSIPVVGVCRGMQFLNEQLGGSLVHIKDHVNKSHTLESFASWIPKMRLYNSFHSWGITEDTIGSSLVPCAFSDNNMYIEAFSHISLPIRAVMWHPERFIPTVGDSSSYYAQQIEIFKFQ